MANYNVGISAAYDSEFGFQLFIGGTGVQLVAGDTLTFSASFNGYSGTASVSNFSSGVFTNTSNLSLTNGQSAVKTIKSGATLGSFSLTFSATAQSAQSKSFSVISSVDTTPNAFSFTDITDAAPSVLYNHNSFIVSGINAAATISISGNGAQFAVNNSTTGWRTTSTTVSNGDRVYVRMNSSSLYNTTVSTTLTIGGVSDVWSIKTVLDPGNGLLIPLGISSGGISASDIMGLFGGATFEIDKYYKGGGRVPNISQNAAIPTSGAIAFSNFYSSYSSLYFTKYPGGMFAGRDTGATPGGSLTLTSEDVSHYTIGYGPDMRDNIEVRHTILSSSFADANYSITPSNYTSWRSASRQLTFSANVSGTVDKEYNISVKVEIRHKLKPTYIISATFNMYLSFFGL
ncbi:hypothetical protein LZP69_10675 [Shewanella sp. AS1]|uniref:hypothetical protein n=1 Tax=Shewanella sp. AS1 TaxID=2907626 RepID=UPI001F3CFFC3|nr:hypothetical protein [Shewanella sp. AS1]MCE9679624.1 hypothetical protein [Shewanella sp. AS1]